jgi:hypothetical protein
MKHVGKMKNNSARIAVVFKTVPDEPNNALVVGTHGLPDSYHDALMSIIESPAGQQANELADVLSARRFPDGEVMLTWLHTRGHIKKVPTNLVLMTPNSQTQIPLDEINAEIDKLKVKPKNESKKSEEIVIGEEIIVDTITTRPLVEEKPVTATDLRSMADKLFKEAQALRKKADEIEPPVKKAAKTVKADA